MIDSAQVIKIIAYALQAIAWLLIVRALLSWFPDLQRYQVVRLLYDITDPIIQPLRRLIPPIGFLDLSVMIAVMFLFVLSGALLQAAQ